MSDHNPYEPGNDDDSPHHEEVSSQRAAYNVVSDTVGGLNVRGSDNLFQAVFIGVTMVLGVIVGAVVVLTYDTGGLPWWMGGIMGAVGGMVVGFFASGIYLMVYRLVRHAKGKHD